MWPPSAALASGPGTAGVLLLALVLAALWPAGAVAGRLRLPHPLAPFDALVRWAAPRLDRRQRSRPMRLLRGIIVMLVLVGAAVGFGLALEALLRPRRYGWVVEAMVVAACLPHRAIVGSLKRVAAALPDLRRGQDVLAAAFGAVEPERDAHGVARAAIEAAAVAFAGRVAAAAFWFAAFGLPGLLASRVVDLGVTAGRQRAAPRAFREAPRRMDDALDLPPTLLTVPLLALAALVTPRGKPFAALGSAGRGARSYPVVSAGLAIGAAAGALGLALAGRPYEGGWIGRGTARAAPVDVRRMAWLLWLAWLLLAAAAALAFAAAPAATPLHEALIGTL